MGGHIEQVHPSTGSLDFLVDEEGLLKGLEINTLASLCLMRPIVGPLVVLPEGLLL